MAGGSRSIDEKALVSTHADAMHFMTRRSSPKTLQMLRCRTTASIATAMDNGYRLHRSTSYRRAINTSTRQPFASTAVLELCPTAQQTNKTSLKLGPTRLQHRPSVSLTSVADILLFCMRDSSSIPANQCGYPFFWKVKSKKGCLIP